MATILNLNALTFECNLDTEDCYYWLTHDQDGQELDPPLGEMEITADAVCKHPCIAWAREHDMDVQFKLFVYREEGDWLGVRVEAHFQYDSEAVQFKVTWSDLVQTA